MIWLALRGFMIRKNILLLAAMLFAFAANAADREPTGDELHEIGWVTAIEDNGYPYYTVSIQFHQGQDSFPLSANAEELGLGGEIANLQGHRVVVYYVSGDENSLMDIRAGGQSLLGDAAPARQSSWSSITGSLSGADDVSGDEPGRITIISEAGESQSFDFFVTPEMVDANGGEVTAYYESGAYNRITYLRDDEE